MTTFLPVFLADRALRDDPLSGFAFACDGQRDLARYALAGVESNGQAGNSGGKTTVGAAVGIACVQQRPTLCGLAIPRQSADGWVHWVLTETRRQQVDSTQATYLKWLGPEYGSDGKRRYKIGWSSKALGYIETIYVRPWGAPSDDETTWNRIVFQCEEGGGLEGGRVDSIHADEPPSRRRWEECQARARANRILIRYITATYKELVQWDWVELRFAGTENTVKGGRITIQWKMTDNRALSKAHQARLIESWKDDPFFDARVDGSFVNTTGRCPFPAQPLKEQQRICEEPDYVAETVTRSVETTEGLEHHPVSVEWEQFEPWEEGEFYLLVADPSLGINDIEHDPAGIHVVACRKPRLVARYGGYLDAYGLGNLAAAMGAAYHHPLIDADCTGGWGGPFLRALQDRKYRRVNYDIRSDKPGELAVSLGFKMTELNRAEMISAVRMALQQGSFWIRSRAVVATLLGTIMDKKGKILAGPGRHDEDLICLGRTLYLMQQPGMVPRPRPTQHPTMEDVLERVKRPPDAPVTQGFVSLRTRRVPQAVDPENWR